MFQIGSRLDKKRERKQSTLYKVETRAWYGIEVREVPKTSIEVDQLHRKIAVINPSSRQSYKMKLCSDHIEPSRKQTFKIKTQNWCSKFQLSAVLKVQEIELKVIQGITI